MGHLRLKTAKATPSKQDLSTSYPEEVLLNIPNDNLHPFISKLPPPRACMYGLLTKCGSRWLDIDHVLFSVKHMVISCKLKQADQVA